MGKIKIGAVINDSSGPLTEEESGERLKEIRELLYPRVGEGNLTVVNGTETEKEVKRLIKDGIDILVIGGGDGTVSTAAELVKDTKIALLVLPMGTRNHFARDIGMPEEPVDAIKLLDRHNVKTTDLGEVNGHVFINNATIGLYPDIVKDREEKTEKHGWRKWRAQIAATFKALGRLPRLRLTIEGDEFRMKLFTPLLFVGNNEYKNIFSSDSMRPSLSKGKLWLCVAETRSIWSLVRMAGQLAVKGMKGAENLKTLLVTEVTVKPRKKKISVAIDGEIHKLSTPLRFKTLKNSLKVVVP